MCCAKIWLKLDSGFVEEVQKRKVYRWTDRQTTSMTDRLKKEKNEIRTRKTETKQKKKNVLVVQKQYLWTCNRLFAQQIFDVESN